MALVTYSVHTIVVGFSSRRRHWLTGEDHKMVVFLPVCCCEEQIKETEGVEDEKTFMYGLT